MKSHDFRGVIPGQPFCPFSFSTVAGATYSIDAPDDAWHTPDGAIVAVSAPGGGFQVGSFSHIKIPKIQSTMVVSDSDGLTLLDSDQIEDIKLIIEPTGRAARIERLRTLKREEPFVSFVMHLADGRRLPVPTVDRMMISPDDGTGCLVGKRGAFDILHADEITDVEPGPGAAPATRS